MEPHQPHSSFDELIGNKICIYFNDKLYDTNTILCKIMTEQGSDKGIGYYSSDIIEILCKIIRENITIEVILGLIMI